MRLPLLATATLSRRGTPRRSRSSSGAGTGATRTAASRRRAAGLRDRGSVTGTGAGTGTGIAGSGFTGFAPPGAPTQPARAAARAQEVRTAAAAGIAFPHGDAACPAVRASRSAGTAPAAAPPAANLRARRTAASASGSGRAAPAGSGRSAASMPVPRVTPRRASRSRSSDRPRDSRLERVPSASPSRRAASRRDTPSSSQSMRGSR